MSDGQGPEEGRQQREGGGGGWGRLGPRLRRGRGRAWGPEDIVVVIIPAAPLSGRSRPVRLGQRPTYIVISLLELWYRVKQKK